MGTDIRTTEHIFASRALNGPACSYEIRLGTAFWSPMMSSPQASPRNAADGANVPAIPNVPPTPSPMEARTLNDLSFIAPPNTLCMGDPCWHSPTNRLGRQG